jgi:hypothetical protein
MYLFKFFIKLFENTLSPPPYRPEIAVICNRMQAPKNEKSPKTKVFELTCNTINIVQ